MISDAKKNANRKWDSAHYGTVSTRMSREELQALRSKLTSRGITVHSFVKNVCELYLASRDESFMRMLEPQFTDEEQNRELDDIVRGRSLR